ncbi:thiamine pyrophosphate-dependent dehydrogenase E1 component subunit alpha [Spirochaetota bacterium]
MTSKQKKPEQSKLTKENLINLYTTMVRVRRVEETLCDVFTAGEIPGFLHVCIGQEATPAAVCTQLTPDDYIATTHRGHGHAIAKGIELKTFMAELFGKKNGFCMGRSGSMHVADKNLGIIGANGIVGAGLPVAAGAALAAQYKDPGRVSVAFFGDGATEQGTFHETLNMAAIWKLPVIFACENNGWAQFTPESTHMSIRDIAIRAQSYGIPAEIVDNDVLEVHGAAKTAIDRARKGDGPTLIEVKCHRWQGHYVGDPQKYRDPKDVDSATSKDCLLKFEDQLLKDKVLTKAKADEILKKINSEVEEAVEYARSSPAPDPSELMEGLYV